MTINDVLNLNKYKIRSRDIYVIILKNKDKCFTLGEYTYVDWTAGRLPLELYCYTCKCLDATCKVNIITRGNSKLYKLYIDNEDLQREIYEMQDNDYNKRLTKEKIR